ncbi:MAG TPA: hypothetical protein VFK32_00910, partial [Tepidiformaceae bacterium]|nr:hypothetical protein [Tepidiformaceae bacterium]
MDLRINEVHPTTPSNPFLSPAAANRAWLAPALRARGVEITADDRTATLTHLHGDATSPASRRGRVIRTSHSFDRQGAEVTAVLSHKQAGLLGGQISAVIAPALATDELAAGGDREDHLCFVFDGRDEYALAAALAIGASSERPLVALVDRSTTLSERCSEVVAAAEQARRIRLERVEDDLLPAVLANAGAYLAVGRSAF